MNSEQETKFCYSTIKHFAGQSKVRSNKQDFAEDGLTRSIIITKDNGHETIGNVRNMKFQAQTTARKVHFSEGEDKAQVADTSYGHEAPAAVESAVESAKQREQRAKVLFTEQGKLRGWQSEISTLADCKMDIL